jgi:NAD(P)-dependent dehydrogenase (short-subunit alcohol dehydrogenase family)/acyl carrier protein
LVTQLATEVLSPATEPVVAYRGRHRWVQAFEPAPLGTDTTVLRERGVYLITGGLGRIGLALAEYLARDFHARLMLLDVSAPPPKEEWPAWLKEKGPRDPTSRQIQKLQELESAGGKVMVMAANVADCNGIKAAISAAGERFGAVHGIFHGAGITDPSYFKPIADTTTANSDLHFAPKVQGALALDEALRGQPLDFVILWSSLSVILGGPGCSAHAAASHFLDAFALSHPPGERTQWISVDWDDWANVETDPASKVGGNGSEFGLAAAERVAAFQRILSNHGLRQVIVATRDLRLRLERQTESQPVELEAPVPVPPVDNSLLHSRPEVRTNYVPAQSEAEKLLTGIWEALLGIAKPGVDDNFFDLGGDSLLLMRLQAKLREVFEVDLSSAEMFQYPTIRGLAGRINQPVADSRGLAAVRDRARRQKALLTQSQVTNS